MKASDFKEGERAIVIAISGSIEFKNFLLANGISLGSIIKKNYSPKYAKQINLTVGSKMMALAKEEFLKLELASI